MDKSSDSDSIFITQNTFSKHLDSSSDSTVADDAAYFLLNIGVETLDKESTIMWITYFHQLKE